MKNLGRQRSSISRVLHAICLIAGIVIVVGCQRDGKTSETDRTTHAKSFCARRRANIEQFESGLAINDGGEEKWCGFTVGENWHSGWRFGLSGERNHL
jgi:hypothetical protein